MISFSFFSFFFFCKETTRPFKLLIMTRVRQAISGHAWDDVSSSPLSRGVSLWEIKNAVFVCAWVRVIIRNPRPLPPPPSPLPPKRTSPPPSRAEYTDAHYKKPNVSPESLLARALQKKRNIEKSKGSLARSVTLQCRMSRVKVANQGVRKTRCPKVWYINRNYFTSTAMLRYRSFVRCIYLGAAKAGTPGA